MRLVYKCGVLWIILNYGDTAGHEQLSQRNLSYEFKKMTLRDEMPAKGINQPQINSVQLVVVSYHHSIAWYDNIQKG